MKLVKNYPGLSETLLCLKDQADESIPFANKFLPNGKMSPEEIFDFLKDEVTFMYDPEPDEVLQCMQTLFSKNNVHSFYGAGDCDCFTIAALASLYAKGYRNIGIVLAGRNKKVPVHIYAYVNDIPFDLTNDEIGQERSYPFKQRIPVAFPA